ncbi:MAG: exodeoxyribonuclease VII small subunit [Anaerolinea sp.]|nr:exodeoxyribonuclease VII small subunit [Anaerolinea sp.]
MEELTFEQAYTELERITRALEAGDLPLDAALALFEQGAQLSEQCDRLLRAAELRVRQILPDGAGGYEAAPFDQWQEESG